MTRIKPTETGEKQAIKEGPLGQVKPLVRQFPIQGTWSRARHKSIPAMNIPWDMIAPHEAQALYNHAGQNLETLARRGGLSHCEAIAVLEDRNWQEMDIDGSVLKLTEMVAAYLSARE